MCNGEGIGLCREHLQELYTVYLTRFRSCKIALPTFKVWCLYRYLVHDYTSIALKNTPQWICSHIGNFIMDQFSIQISNLILSLEWKPQEGCFQRHCLRSVQILLLQIYCLPTVWMELHYYVNGGRGCGVLRSVFIDTLHVSRSRFKIACSHQFFYHKTLNNCIPNIFFQVKSAYKSFFSCELSLNTGVFLSLWPPPGAV